MSNQAFSKIWIVVILVILVGGGFLAWRYWKHQKEEISRAPKEVGVVKLPVEEVVNNPQKYLGKTVLVVGNIFYDPLRPAPLSPYEISSEDGLYMLYIDVIEQRGVEKIIIGEAKEKIPLSDGAVILRGIINRQDGILVITVDNLLDAVVGKNKK